MCDAIEERGTYTVEQLREGELVLHCRAQRERVGEKTDQRLGLCMMPATGRGSDNDVLRPRVAVDQRVETGQQDREEREVARARERAQPIDQVRRQC